LRGTVVECQSLAGELFMSCAYAMLIPLIWYTVRYRSINQANSAFHPFGVDK